MDQTQAAEVAYARGSDAPALYRLTAEQFETMVYARIFEGSDNRVELREGLLWRMNAQYIPHMTAKGDMYDALRATASPLRVGSEGSVRVGDYDVPQPDVIVWEPIRGRGAVPVERVRLAVEVCSATHTEHLGRKPALYASAGIPEYWIVDLPGRVVHQRWAPADGAYSQAKVIPFGDAVASATIPGLVVGTAALQEQDIAE